MPRRAAQTSLPALLSIRAPLDAVRSALLGCGATTEDRWSVALVLGGDLIVLAYDRAEMCTTIAIGGSDVATTAQWVAAQLDEWGWAISELLPPLKPNTA
ncbi:hypothetical protein [Nocardioides pocheonensis]|uniref:Uncharacterized protein n=1 Tax=Nocardioides pocheonensis TaxID=661485 RepID=A0A3N0GKZ7_9ACTN|nr:hypothetical protein [Nocardioides pocheonensis]RNM13157.1 hypothetical protein EFL26_17210 [Nocardioides pocheonensis]